MRNLFFVTRISGALLVLCSPTAAKEAGPHLDEVIVTASPLEESQFDLLRAGSVLQGETLERHLEPSLGETLGNTPGVSSTFFGPAASRPVIRGLGGDRVRVLINGIGSIDASSTSPDHAVAADLLTAQRIEVLRGPSTLLYGSSALGGVINMIDERIASQHPDSAISGAARSALSSSANDAAGAASLTADLGKLIAHLDGFARDTGDYNAGGGRGSIANSDIVTRGATAGLSQVGDQGFLGAAFSVTESNYGIPGTLDEGGTRIDLNQKRLDVAGQARGRLGPFKTAKLRFGYADYRHREITGGKTGTEISNQGWEGRLELVQRKTGALKGVVGLQLRHRDFSVLGDEPFTPPTTTARWGLFALEQLDFGAWEVEASARFDHQRAVADALGISRKFNSFSASGGLSWRVSDDYVLGLTAARTQRLPSAEELFSNGPHDATRAFEIGDPNMKKETGTTLELSLRKRAGLFVANANLFYTRYNDFVFEAFTGTERDGLQVLRFQQDKAEFWGGETQAHIGLMASAQASLGLDLTADFVRATLTRLHQPLPRMPPLRFGATLHYDSDRLAATAELRRTTGQHRVAAFETVTIGYTMVNASLTVHPFARASNIALTLRAKNITNVLARSHVSFLKDVAPLPGRDLRLSIRVDW